MYSISLIIKIGLCILESPAFRCIAADVATGKFWYSVIDQIQENQKFRGLLTVLVMASAPAPPPPTLKIEIETDDERANTKMIQPQQPLQPACKRERERAFLRVALCEIFLDNLACVCT